MARLRVRIELNRRMAGVPLEKMASVVEETRKFFYLLAEDVHIEAERGEWLASDFDAESLNFTAEYSGPVSPEQAQAFGAAFSGATSLRRVTIAQFTRIAEFLGEDELVGFGLYQSDQELEPGEWRCLSKRDALRFGEEIRLLAQAAGEQAPETQLPAVLNGSVAGKRLFKDRREREALAADPSRLVRELESSLSRRIALLEDEVAAHTRKIQEIGNHPEMAEERFQKLLAAMETFWAQAPRTLPQLPAPQLPAPQPPAPAVSEPPAPIAAAAEPSPAPAFPSVPEVTTESKQPRNWPALCASAAVLLAILGAVVYPGVQHQWNRFISLEALSPPAPRPPAAPNLELPIAGQPVPPRPPVQALVKTVAAQSEKPFVGPLIPLEIPPRLKTKIQSEVRVNVLVAIDPEGNVTGARVASMQGERALDG